MSKRIHELTAAGALTGTEPAEISQLSASVTLTAATISFAAADNSINDSGGGLITAGFVAGKSIHVTGAVAGANNLYSGRIGTLTANKATILTPEGDAIVDGAAGPSITITQWESKRTSLQDVADLAGDGDASDVTYTPADPTDWNGSADPGDVDQALDQLAMRVKDVEGAPSNGTSGSPITYSIDTGSTADSDPGAGLLKFDNATQSAATMLYVDNATADAVTLTTYLASLAQSGFVSLVQSDDPGVWRVYKITAVTAASGYYKLTVVNQAGVGSFADNALVRLAFDSDAAGTTSTTSTTSIFDRSKSGGTLSSAKNEYQTVTSGSSVDIVNIASGAGYISSLFLAFITTDSASWRTGSIKIYYDGEVTPTIDMQMERFFQSVYMGSTGNKKFYNQYFGYNSGSSANVAAMFCNLPIPFSNGIKITITNGGPVSYTLWTTTTIHAGVPNTWSKTRKLRAKDFYVASAAANSVQTFLDEQSIGAGRLAAVWLLEDDVPGNIDPRGAPLEGNIKIFLNGAGSPQYESSGTEDYFLMGFYGDNVPSGSWNGEVGTTFFTALATYGFWRHHIENPIDFSSGLKITWNVGDTSQVSFTGTARAWATVYYYTET